MKHLPLLEEHPKPVQFVLAVVVPALFGALTGYFLGVSEPVYLVLSLIGIVGGVGAGYDHLGAKAGAARGVIAGSVFGASILIAHELHGAHAKAHLPEPAILLVAVTTILAVVFAALGGWLRARSMDTDDQPADASAGSAVPPSATDERNPMPATEGTIPVPPADQTSPAPAANGAVSLNSGTFEEYRALGMSVTQANRVIAYRERLGGYSSLGDLDRVPGFSKEFLVRVKRQVAP